MCSYAAQAKIISDRYRDQIQTPTEIAVHWVKHVAKNKGAPHLRSAAIDLPFSVYYNLDVYAAVIAVAASILFALKKSIQIVRGQTGEGNVHAKRSKLKSK